jgi:uncharacterized membrane protein YsdA (DUF1294 family)
MKPTRLKGQLMVWKDDRGVGFIKSDDGVSEKTLHLCELAGGWLGAFVAQRKLYHKSRKSSYQVVFWLIVIIHIGFWVAWLFLGRTLISLILSSPGK